MNRLENRVEAIEAAPADGCLSTIKVAQCDDYEQYFDSGPISPLDIDNAAPDWRVVIRTCRSPVDARSCGSPCGAAFRPPSLRVGSRMTLARRGGWLSSGLADGYVTLTGM